MKITFAIQENFGAVLDMLNGKEETPYYCNIESPNLTDGVGAAKWSLHEENPDEWDGVGCNWPTYVTKSGMTILIDTATSRANYIIRPADGKYGGNGGCTVTYNGPYRGLLEQYLLPKMTPIFFMGSPVLHSGGVSTLLEYWEMREAAKREDEVTHPRCLREGLKYEIPPYFETREFDLSDHSFEDALLWALKQRQLETTRQEEILTVDRESFSVKKTEDDTYLYFTSLIGGAYILQKSTMKLSFYGSKFEMGLSAWHRTCRMGQGFPIFDLGLK